MFFFFLSVTLFLFFFIQTIQFFTCWRVNITYFFLHCDLEKKSSWVVYRNAIPYLKQGWWAVYIAICWNVRKGLRKEIAGTYLNLALYFCVFSKYLRNCADTMSPPYLFTYWNATSLNYVNVCWVMALTVTNFSICQWSFKWLLKNFYLCFFLNYAW